MSNGEGRHGLRIAITKGTAFLRSPGIPSIACQLSDLGDGGCRCTAPFHVLDPRTAERWRNCLAPGFKLSLDLSIPQHLPALNLNANIRHLAQAEDGSIQIGLSFEALTQDAQLQLKRALLLLAVKELQGNVVSGTQPAVEAGAPPKHHDRTLTPLPGTISAARLSAVRNPAAAQAGSPGVPAAAIAPAVVSGAAASPSSTATPAPPPPAKPAGPATRLTETNFHASESGLLKQPTTIMMNAGQVRAALKEVSNTSAAQNAPAAKRKSSRHFPKIPPGEGYRKKKLGEILVELGLMESTAMETAAVGARAHRERLGRYLLRRGIVTAIDLCGALSLQSGLPMTDLTEFEPPPELLATFPYLTMLRYEFVPFSEGDGVINVATTRPMTEKTRAELELRAGRKLAVHLAEDDIVMNMLYRMQPVKDRKLRKHKRYSLAVPVSFQFCNAVENILHDKVYGGQTINVSEGGVTVGLKDDLRGRGICARVSFTVSPHKIEALCSLRYINRRETPGWVDSPWIVGFEFLEMSDETRTALHLICGGRGAPRGKGE